MHNTIILKGLTPEKLETISKKKINNYFQSLLEQARKGASANKSITMNCILSLSEIQMMSMEELKTFVEDELEADCQKRANIRILDDFRHTVAFILKNELLDEIKQNTVHYEEIDGMQIDFMHGTRIMHSNTFFYYDDRETYFFVPNEEEKEEGLKNTWRHFFFMDFDEMKNKVKLDEFCSEFLSVEYKQALVKEIKRRIAYLIQASQNYTELLNACDVILENDLDTFLNSLNTEMLNDMYDIVMRKHINFVLCYIKSIQ